MPSADLIIVNADIHTMDGANPRATALAIKDGRVLAVGGEDAVRDLSGPETRTMDAGGRVVLPGFQDTHIHLQDSGIAFTTGADLAGCADIAQLQDCLRKQAADTTDRVWVQGIAWDSATFITAGLDRHALDEAVPDRPVYIMAADGHNATVNSMALRELNITAETPHPPNGEIVHGDDGEPTGMLYEDAIWWALGMLPKPSDEDYANGVRYACAHANKHGITGVLDAMVGERHLRIYTALDNAGELNMRVASTSKVMPEESLEDAVARLKSLRERFRSPRVKMHSAKFFLDGVMENGTAAMLEDYESGGNAPIMFDIDKLNAMFKAFDAERFQLHVHTIGDHAIRVALDAIEGAQAVNEPWPALHQLAHIQCIAAAEIPRFRELRVVANWQPYWTQPDAALKIALDMVGEERGKRMYAVNAVIETGAPYAISSDWFVSTLNPFEIMQGAVTRQFPDAKGPDEETFLPDERITVETVVRGYTLNAAAGAWRAETTGSLAIGKCADVIVLDRDIFNISPYELGDTQVLLTMIDGAEVYRADGFDA